MMRLNPFLAFVKTLGHALQGRLHFPKERVGETIIMEDGQQFVVFRHAIVEPNPGQPTIPEATFRVRFRIAGMSPKQNIRFSLLPIPFFVGLPGFRSKLWTLNQTTGDFQGIYEWDTIQDAENYTRSFAMKFMTRRAVPGSVSSEVVPSPSAPAAST